MHPVARDGGATSTEVVLHSTPTSGPPGNPGPSHPLRFLVTQASQRSRLKVRLLFPDGELPDQNYSVSANLLVTDLHHRVSSLTGVQEPIVLMVSSDWGILDHTGTVTALVLPGTSTPCPYLQHGSSIRVRTQSHSLAAIVSPTVPLTIEDRTVESAISLPPQSASGGENGESLSTFTASGGENGESFDFFSIRIIFY